MSQSGSHDDLSLRSPVFPGGSLLSAIFDRDVVRLSDRGGASGLIGDRWSDVCNEEMLAWPGKSITAAGDIQVHVDRVVRLDAVPAIARTASRKKLQNPDYIVVGNEGQRQVLFAADAKFSVETAGVSQVSREALESLLELGNVIREPLGEVDAGADVLDGIFISPDYSLTHYMLGRKRGFRSVSVNHDQIELLPVTAVGFLKPIEGASMIPLFARADGYDRPSRTSLLLALYYFRLVRAGIGCWNDERGSLLIPKQKPELDLHAVAARTRELADTATSAWEIIEQWDAQAEQVRQQRERINDVATIPIVNRELREQVETAAEQADKKAPSLNQVRRRIGAWFRGQLVDEFGPLNPPVEDFSAILREIDRRSAELRPLVDEKTREIISEMLDEVPAPNRQ